MFCPKCGTQNPEHAKFCFQCAYSFANLSGKSAATTSEKKVVGAIAAPIITLAIIAALGIVAFIVYEEVQRNNRHSENSDANAAYISTTAPSQPIQQVQQIKNGNQILVEQAFTVAPSRYHYYKFSIPQGWRNAVVRGSFTASGGQGNDIQVMITDENGLTNIMNGHSGRVWYDSGKVTVGDVNVRLSPGTYYVVFNNSFSMFSNKAVNADINLSYEYF